MPHRDGYGVPAAAAGSMGDLESGVELSRSFERGLRSRTTSCFLAGGDRERLSNRDILRGSGSVWSKRERLTARAPESSMLSKFSRQIRRVRLQGSFLPC